MGDYTGQVVQNNEQKWRFANDEDDGNNLQRLSRTRLKKDEIDLQPYENKYLLVHGEWEHEWMLNATIVKSSDTPINQTQEDRAS